MSAEQLSREPIDVSTHGPDGHWDCADIARLCALRDRHAQEIARLREALERAELVAAPLKELPVTTGELRRIRNAGKITFDRMVHAITSCLIDMREASSRIADETPATPETRPCNCAPDYCMAAGMLRSMMSPYVRCKRPTEKSGESQ